MDTSLGKVFSFVRLTTGRRLSIYNKLRPAAAARGLADLVAHIDRAITHDQQTRALENEWAASPDRAVYADDVRRLDGLVDITLTSVRDVARGQAAGLDPDDPIAIANDRLQREAFPAGVVAITSLPYIDQVAAVEVIVTKLQTTLAQEVTLLGLTARTQRLAALTADYRAAIDAYPEPVEYATVRAGQLRGHSLLLEITARIVGTFYDEESADHAAARDELLAPILTQVALVRARNRARRRAGAAAAQPGTDEPGTDEPGTDEPDTDEPDIDDEPGIDEPGIDEPGIDEPATDDQPDPTATP